MFVRRFPLAAFLLPLLVVMACQPQESAPQAAAPEAPVVEYLTSEAMSGFPFSEAVRVGNLLFVSGQTGTDPETGELVPGGIAEETRQTMTNIKTTLERYGATMDDVVKCTVMLDDIAEWGAMNEVYRTFYTDHFPARSALGASGLAMGARVEIECIAAM